MDTSVLKAPPARSCSAQATVPAWPHPQGSWESLPDCATPIQAALSPLLLLCSFPLPLHTVALICTPGAQC